MSIGSKIELIVPPNYAFGSDECQDYDKVIPPNSAL